MRAASATSAPASASAERGPGADALARAGDDRDATVQLEPIEDHRHSGGRSVFSSAAVLSWRIRRCASASNSCSSLA